jgi:mannan endo-1,4-beta-mannosidase
MNESVDKNNATEYYSEQMQDVYSNVTAGASVSTTSSAVYYNGFEDGTLPNKVNWADDVSSVAAEDLSGNKALGFNVNFGGVSEWDSETSLCFFTSSTETIKADSVIQFDVLIPKTSNNFTGEIKFGGVLQDKNWTDKGDGYGSVSESDFTDESNGYLRKTVSVKTSKDTEGLNNVVIKIAGYKCNYAGKIYIDNIKLSQEQVADKYVKLTDKTTAQGTVNPEDLSIPSTVKLVDSGATEKTADLYAYLKGVGKSDYVLYGHQNDTHHKAGHKDTDNTNSDTKDVTGSTSAITGIDALSLTGAELQLTDEDKANGVNDLITKAANIGIDASKEGGIVTLSAHMPNFEGVKEKGKDSTGNYDYSGYTPGVTTGNIVSRIMPDGDLNDVYVGYLDVLAKYAHKLEDAGVPVLFRPFHENNGSWFWWGKAFCDEEAYKNVYR